MSGYDPLGLFDLSPDGVPFPGSIPVFPPSGGTLPQTWPRGLPGIPSNILPAILLIIRPLLIPGGVVLGIAVAARLSYCVYMYLRCTASANQDIRNAGCVGVDRMLCANFCAAQGQRADLGQPFDQRNFLCHRKSYEAGCLQNLLDCMASWNPFRAFPPNPPACDGGCLPVTCKCLENGPPNLACNEKNEGSSI